MKKKLKPGDIVEYGMKGEIALIDDVADPGVYWAWFNSRPLSLTNNAYGILYECFQPLTYICTL